MSKTYVVSHTAQFHGGPASGGEIERVFASAGKKHADLKKRTIPRDKTLETTLKAGMNAKSCKLPSCDDNEVVTMMMAHTGNASNLRWVGGW